MFRIMTILLLALSITACGGGRNPDQEKKDAVTLAAKKKQRVVLLLICSVIVSVFVFSGFIFRSLKITRRQKALIELKNKETETQKQSKNNFLGFILLGNDFRIVEHSDAY